MVKKDALATHAIRDKIRHYFRRIFRKGTALSGQFRNSLAIRRDSITLYHVEREDIKIHIVARFEEDKLIIDGYDIGKTVKEAWGDSDYEYVMTINQGSLPPLYRLLGVETGDRKALLKAIAERFHGNKCFSALGDFLDQNNIEHETFTWT